MSQDPLYGVRSEDEVDLSVVRPNIASSFSRMLQSTRKKDSAVVTLVVMAGASIIFEVWAPVIVAAGVLLVSYVMTKKFFPILRVPIQESHRSELKQFTQLGNKRSKREDPNGIFFIGWDIGTGQELWYSNEDAREHFWIIGTTGSGKTELLMAFVVNALSWGSGVYMVDGKGDVATARKLYQLTRSVGRDDDFLCINFMVPGRNSGFAGMLTNTTNPMSTFGQDEIIQMLVGMLPPGGGESSTWQEKAISMISSLIPVLVWMRDNLGIPMSVNDLRASMVLQSLVKIAGRHGGAYEEVPSEIIAPVRSYLLELGVPEDVIENNGQTSPEIGNQHSYRMGFFTRPLASLGDSYAHIFGKSVGDVDVFDAVLNRRIVISILPALGKSMSEMENLGRILIASMKVMLGDALGSQIEGTWDRAVEQRQTASMSPYPVIFDEVSFYIADGMSMLPAQGRALGFSFIFALQSLQGALNRNQKEASEAFGTVNTKIYMKIEDSMASAEQADKAGGKAYVPKATGYERKMGDFGSRHSLQENVQLDYASRNDIRDLRKQFRGEITLQNGDTIVRAKSFYIPNDEIFNKSEAVVMRLNHFIDLDEIRAEDELEGKATEALFELLMNNNLRNAPGFDENISSREIDTITDMMIELETSRPQTTLLEASAVGFALLSRTIARVFSPNDGRTSPRPDVDPTDPPSNFKPSRPPRNIDPVPAAPDDDPDMVPMRPVRPRRGRRPGGLDNPVDSDTIVRVVTALDQPQGASAADVDGALNQALTRNLSPTHTPEPVVDPAPQPEPGGVGGQQDPILPIILPADSEEVAAIFRDMFTNREVDLDDGADGGE